MSADEEAYVARLAEEIAARMDQKLVAAISVLAVDGRPLLTKDEAAARLNVKLRNLEYMIQRGEIETVTVGARSVRIEAAALDRYIAARRVDSEEPSRR